MSIDLDRGRLKGPDGTFVPGTGGVEQRQHRQIGMWVNMYVDDPGRYYNDHGVEIPEKLAGEAGFPVKEYAKAREKAAEMAKAKAQIEAAYGAAGSGAKADVLDEKNGFKLIDVGAGFNVVGADGNPINPKPLPEKVALHLFNSMTADKPEEEPRDE